jgi:tRNA A37 threonylcarbamoyladenosine dehydratase
VIDAIDSVNDKALLIQNATKSTATLFSSMGAARKIDATQVRVSEFWKVEGCPLARALRTKMKKEKMLPTKKFQCVWSPEVSSVSGTIAPVVGAFGMTLAGLVVQDICRKTCNN